jgi:hypothetical protein
MAEFIRSKTAYSSALTVERKMQHALTVAKSTRNYERFLAEMGSGTYEEHWWESTINGIHSNLVAAKRERLTAEVSRNLAWRSLIRFGW